MNKFIPLFIKESRYCMNYDKRKRPFVSSNHKPCDICNKEVLSNFYESQNALQCFSDFVGIGYSVFPESKVVFIDIDHCIDENGNYNQQARDILEHIVNPTYIEKSMSGTGLHIFVKGVKPTSSCKGDVEVYDCKHYCAMTFDVISANEVSENQTFINYVCDKYLNHYKTTENPARTASNVVALSVDKIISIAQNARNGQRFIQLYSGDISGYHSQSEAEMALFGILAFYTGRDAEMMKEIYLMSGLANREKSFRKDYLDRTIEKAISECKQVYSGKPK